MQKLEIRGVLFLYIATAMAWVWLNPVFEAPDEPFHLGYVNQLIQKKRLPSAEDAYQAAKFLQSHVELIQHAEVLEAGQSKIWFHWAHPPLYYLLQTLPLRLFFPNGFQGALIAPRTMPSEHRERGYFRHDLKEFSSWSRPIMAIRVLRLVSALLGLLTVWFTARLAALAAPDSKHLPLLAAGMLAFIPQFTFMTASVNNDAAGYLASTVGLVVLIHIMRRSWRPLKAGLAIGLVLGISTLSKGTTQFLWPLTAIVSWLAYKRLQDRLFCAAVAFLTGLAFAAIYFVPLGRAYPDLLGFVVTGHSSFANAASIGPFIGQNASVNPAYIFRVLQTLDETFWGQFGWNQILLDPTALAIYHFLAAFALIGWIQRSEPKQGKFANNSPVLIVLASAMAIFLVMTGVVYARIFISQGGRYLLAIGPAIIIFLSMGLFRARPLAQRLLGRTFSTRAMAWSVILAMLLLNWYVLLFCVHRPFLDAWRRVA